MYVPKPGRNGPFYLGALGASHTLSEPFLVSGVYYGGNESFPFIPSTSIDITYPSGEKLSIEGLYFDSSYVYLSMFLPAGTKIDLKRIYNMCGFYVVPAESVGGV